MAYTRCLLMHLRKQQSFLRWPLQWQCYLFYCSADRLIWLVFFLHVFFLHVLKCFSNPSPLKTCTHIQGVTRFFCQIFHEWITKILCSELVHKKIFAIVFVLFFYFLLYLCVILPWIMPNIQSFRFYVIALPLALGCGCTYLANRTC